MYTQTARPRTVRQRERRRGSVSTRIILLQLVVVLVAMGISGIFTTLQGSRQLNASLRLRGEQLLKRLPASLSTPLWNMDNVSIEKLVAVEMGDPDVQGIIVRGDQGTFGSLRDSAGRISPYEEAAAKTLAGAGFQHLEAPVTYQDKGIGNVDVYLS